MGKRLKKKRELVYVGDGRKERFIPLPGADKIKAVVIKKEVEA